MKKILESFYLPSAIGLLEISIKEGKLVSVLKSNKKTKVLQNKRLSPLAKSVQKQLKNYFKGKLKQFDVPLELKGKPFQKKVWKALQKIPWGETITYGELALKIKLPKGARAVGQCCATNPCLILVPCHRVLSQKGLGGFALGLKAKKTLLSLEKTGRD